MKFPYFAIVATSLISIFSCTSTDYCRYVDTKIGSGGYGHVFVGANIPFGMVQLGPTSIPNTWDFCSGYHTTDSTVIGFSHTHLSGAGMPEMQDITVMPVVGRDLVYSRGNVDDQDSGLWSYADRSREVSEPGYYSVPLERYGILAEMTATARVGFQRFTFPASEDAAVVFDMENGDGGIMDVLTGCNIEVLSDTRLRGWRRSTGWADRGWSREDNQIIYFAAEFSRPFDSFEMVDGKYGRAEFVTSSGDEIMLKVALSFSSMEGAQRNLYTELPGWDFDRVRQEAYDLWNQELSRVEVETDDEEALKVFYTALYHSMIFPSLYSDCDEEDRYSNFSLWDTYRAWSPLYTIIRGDVYQDFMASFLDMYRKSGQIPVWPMYGVETDCMIGNPGVIVAADAILKGIDGGLAKDLYDAMKSSVMLDSRWQDLRRKYGYIPFDLHPTQTVAYDLEYAIADAAVAKVAAMLGKQADHSYFAGRGGWWKHHYDCETGFVRGKDSYGNWREPFNPYGITHMADDYCEGTAWQYTWLAPHDIEGLAEVMGGRDNVVERLDRLFAEPSRIDGETVDMTGLLGQYVHGNEPSHHIIYFYSQLGETRKVADHVRKILTDYYTTAADGLCGNEDMGQMSAWYILSSMGLYQVNPFDGRYWFGSPLFNAVTINLPEGKAFTIRAVDNSSDNRYIEKAFLDGKPYEKNYIDYSDIIKGGELVFYMTNV
ncbi:MAG: GH92 family glycosyl hydrolase [Bacteroidales bacterium]|nr:GH92 family glycosyl hydrolase [Bacteroidales bacterium]